MSLARTLRIEVSDPAGQRLHHIAHYSSCKMAEISEKLVAIAGIANIRCSLSDSPQDSECHCSIFEDDVHNQVSRKP